MLTPDHTAIRAMFDAHQEARRAAALAEIEQLRRVLARYTALERSTPRTCEATILRELRREPQTTTHLVAQAVAAGYGETTARGALCRLQSAGKVVKIGLGQRGRPCLWRLPYVDL